MLAKSRGAPQPAVCATAATRIGSLTRVDKSYSDTCVSPVRRNRLHRGLQRRDRGAQCGCDAEQETRARHEDLPMLAKLHTFSLWGIEAVPVDVEGDASAARPMGLGRS